MRRSRHGKGGEKRRIEADPCTERAVQGVAVDWIFAFRIESVGLVVHFGAFISGGRLQAVLDILAVNGTVSGRASCLHENTFVTKN